MASHTYFIFVSCGNPTITAPTEDGSTYDYTLGDTQSFSMSAFSVDDSELSLSYSLDVVSTGSASTTWITTLSSTLGVEMVSTTAQSELVDSYTVTVTATAGCVSKTASFTINVAEVVSPCESDSLTIDDTLSTGSFIYNIGGTAYPIFWDTSIVASDNGYTDCGTLAWTLIDTDTGAAPLVDVFTVTITGGAVDIQVQTDNTSLAKTYNLKATVKYVDFPAEDFTNF